MEPNEVAVTEQSETPKETIHVTSETDSQEPEHGTDTAEDKAASPQPKKAEESEQQKKNSRNQQRKAQREQLIRDNAAMAEQIRQLTAKTEKPAEARKPKDLSKEPNIQDYTDVLEYTRDLAKYEANNLLSERDKRQQELADKQVTESFLERTAEYIATKPEFAEKAEGFLEIRKGRPDLNYITDRIIRSPMSAEIIEHLDAFPGDAMALGNLKPEAIPGAIKQIEAFIKKGNEKPKAEAPRVTQAPPPIKSPANPVGSSGKSLSQMTQEEIEKMPQSEFNKRFYNNRRY